MTKKLYELPDKSPMRIGVLKDGGDAGKTEDYMMTDCVFDHIDGMYSYCYVEADRSKVFHLGAACQMKLVDGRWELAE